MPLLERIIEEPSNNSFIKNKSSTAESKSEGSINSSSTVKPSNIIHKTGRRQTRRGGRGGSGNNNLNENKLRPLSITGTYDISSLHYSKTHNGEEAEWLRASKRRATVIFKLNKNMLE